MEIIRGVFYIVRVWATLKVRKIIFFKIAYNNIGFFSNILNQTKIKILLQK